MGKSSADNFILSQTDSIFLTCLQFQRSFEQEIANSKELKSLPTTGTLQKMPMITVTSFAYYFTTKSGQLFYYRTRGRMSCVVEIHFDRNGSIVDPEDLSKLTNVTDIYDAEVINAVTAVEKAKPHLTNKNVKPNNTYLVYDLTDNTMYWQIRSEYGFRDRTEQTVDIDASTGEFIRLKKFEYRRKLL